MTNKNKLANKIKVENMISTNGNKIANQFILYTDKGVYFQSYESIIAFQNMGKIILDSYYWNYSRTTSKYRNIFLGMTTAEVKKRIKEGSIKLTNLN
jgi:hypothetical protein